MAPIASPSPGPPLHLLQFQRGIPKKKRVPLTRIFRSPRPRRSALFRGSSVQLTQVSPYSHSPPDRSFHDTRPHLNAASFVSDLSFNLRRKPLAVPLTC